MLGFKGNKCTNSCEEGKIFLFKENICNDTCDESIYVLKDSQCGLCKDMYPDKPYKLINSPICLSSENIPEEAEIYFQKELRFIILN